MAIPLGTDVDRLSLLVSFGSSKTEIIISDVSPLRAESKTADEARPISFPSFFSRWPLFRWSDDSLLDTRKAQARGTDERKKDSHTARLDMMSMVNGGEIAACPYRKKRMGKELYDKRNVYR